MIIVTGIAEIAPESIEAIKDAARVMASASRAEAGCHEYAFYEDIENPGTFRVYEEWESPEALRAHFAEPHMARFQKTLEAATILKLDISQFERGADVKVNT